MPDPGMATEDFDRFISQMTERTAGLERAIAGAQSEEYELSHADGEITITADGRPRLVSVYVSARALRASAGELEATLVEAVNNALRNAQERSAERLLAALDPGARDAVEQARAEADRAGSPAARPDEWR
ncbi:YbaB/EbfC family nucleoid-associated protein [Longispora albida]|uniref:YbaB/EbfC family nucleoid-associated protein n=1 Tax=Longispora albida TaxID=203523 RepID=UPI000A0289E3|nr:YbaB/EbfC family nucleoid-associated protein [Longispora albida]